MAAATHALQRRVTGYENPVTPAWGVSFACFGMHRLAWAVLCIFCKGCVVQDLTGVMWGQQAHGQRDWALPEGFRIQFEGEAAELFVGGVYVRLFLKNPQFPLRDPKARAQHLTPPSPACLTLFLCPGS